MYLMLYNCIQFLDLKINMKLHMNFIEFHIFLESWIPGLKFGPSLLPVFRESQVTPKVRAQTWQMQQQPALLLREVQVEEVSPVDESMGTPLMKQHIADW